MEDSVGHRATHLRFGPIGVTVAKAGGHEVAHGAVHAESLFQPLLRGHGPVDRHLPFVGGAYVVGLGGGGHGANLMVTLLLASVVSVLRRT